MSDTNADFQQELSLWEAASQSSDPKLTIQYLEKYPSGSYSQLAEARLDTLLAKRGEKRVEIKSSPNNPFSAGSASGVMKYSIGDSYSYVKKDLLTEIKVNSTTERVTKVSDSEITMNDGRKVIDLMGNELISPNEHYLTPAQFFAVEYQLGKKWVTRFGWRKSDGVDSNLEMEFKVTGREKIKTPAGEFNAFVVEGWGYVEGGNKFEMKYWIDPDNCNRPIWFDRVSKNKRRGHIISAQRNELVSFKQAKS